MPATIPRERRDRLRDDPGAWQDTVIGKSVAINQLAYECQCLPELSEISLPDPQEISFEEFWEAPIDELPKRARKPYEYLKQMLLERRKIEEGNSTKQQLMVDRQALLADQRLALKKWGNGDFLGWPNDYIAFFEGKVLESGDDPIELRKKCAELKGVPIQRIVIQYVAE